MENKTSVIDTMAKEAILKYQEKHPNIDQTCTPNIILRRKLKDATRYYHPTTGKIFNIKNIYNFDNNQEFIDLIKSKPTKCFNTTTETYETKTIPDIVYYPTNSKIQLPYVHNDSQLHVTMFTVITIDTHTEKSESDIREWKILPGANIFFMYDKVKMLYNRNGNPMWDITDKSNKGKFDFNNIMSYGIINEHNRAFIYFSMMSRLMRYDNSYHNNITNTLRSITNYQKVEIKSVYSDRELRYIDSFYMLSCYFDTKELRKSNKTKDTLESLQNGEAVKDLTEEEILKIYKDRKKEAIGYWSMSYQYIGKITTFDEGLAIKIYRVYPDTKGDTTYKIFGMISYLNKKWSYFLHNNSEGFVTNTRVNPIQDYNDVYITNPNEFFKIKEFSYFKSILEGCKETEYLTKIYQMSKHPEIEQLAKMGMTKIAQTLLQDNSVNANTKNMFGILNTKGKTFCEKIGLNKYQLTCVEKMLNNNKNNSYDFRYNKQTVIAIKKYLTGHVTTNDSWDNDKCHVNISSFSNQDFDECIEICKNFNNSGYYNLKYSGQTPLQSYIPCSIRKKFFEDYNANNDLQNYSERDIYVVKADYAFIKKINRSLVKMAKEGDNFTIQHIIQMYCDTVRMYNNLMNGYLYNVNNNELINRERLSNISWEFNKLDHLWHLHDNLIDLTNLVQAEQRRINALSQAEKLKEQEKVRQKTDEKRKYFNATNGKYTIMLPETLSDIVLEGSNLRHCVAGYVNSHANGSTTILFLRKNDELDKSWFTIEVRDGRVIQIHGYSNCWLGSSDESFAAVPFIRKWLKERNITCNPDILTNMSKSYGRNTNQRKLPEAEK